MTYELITAEMIQALSDEIEAVKEGNSGRQIPLQNGRKGGFSAGRLIYTFDLSSELAVPDDTPAQLKVGDNSYRVTVISIDGFEVVLAVEEDLGPRIPAASLNTSLWYLLEILKTRLQETIAGKLPANRDMSLRLFSRKPNESIRPCPSPDFTSARSPDDSPPPPPNEEQKAAVIRALSQRITFVWGPPGTGKTTTINYLVPSLVHNEERVFITSHTNTAVDTVLKAAMKGLTKEEARDGAILRLGQVREDDEEIKKITLEAVVERRGMDLNKQLDAVESRIARVKRDEAEWTLWESNLAKIKELEQAKDAAAKRLSDTRQEQHGIESKIAVLHKEETRLKTKLDEAEAAGFFKRVFGGLNPERIRQELQKAANARTQCSYNLDRVAKDLPALQTAAESADRSLSQALAAMRQKGPIPTMDRVQDELRKLGAEFSRLEQQAKAIREQLQQLTLRVVSEAKVIGATLTKMSTTQELYQSKYDNVIIDEASMALQPHLWLAAALSEKRVVVLGDFRQLQPICVAKSEIAQKRMETSIYQEAGIVDSNQRVQLNDPRLVALRKQYRMHERIGELVNELVYREDENALEHHAPKKGTDPGLQTEPESDHAVVLCDTTSANPWCTRLDGKYSHYNIYSAITAIRLAQRTIEGDKCGKIQVGVICPYAAQARLLNVLAKERGLTDSVKVATVHRFQGNEKDVIIFDLVDGPPFPRPGLPLTNPESKNLLNVAFSRAKGKVVLVGHTGYFESRKTSTALTTTLSYFGKHGRTIDSMNILSGYGDPEVIKNAEALGGRLALGNPEGMSLFHESSFYSAFNRDLVSARERVIIFSPFIQPARTSQMIPMLRGLLEKGIQVVVITRPARRSERTARRHEEDAIELDGSANVVNELKHLGVKVLTRLNLHEKLAFIDERITWMGSLNILSHSHTTEQMTRLENGELTKMILEFNGVVALFRKEERKVKKATRLEEIRPLLARRMSTPNCSQCGRPMVLRIGPYGVFFGCPSFPADKTTVPVPRATLASIIDEMDIPCPRCGEGRMRLRYSQKGVFLGCDRYPDCRTTEPLG